MLFLFWERFVGRCKIVDIKKWFYKSLYFLISSIQFNPVLPALIFKLSKPLLKCGCSIQCIIFMVSMEPYQKYIVDLTFNQKSVLKNRPLQKRSAWTVYNEKWMYPNLQSYCPCYFLGLNIDGSINLCYMIY